MATYSQQDICEAYEALGVAEGKIVYLTSDLAQMRGYEEPGGKALLEAHLRALRSLVGERGTLVVPTSTMNLCGTDTVFCPETTPSFRRGALSEAVRKADGALRSFHPFCSYAAVGAQAAEITQSVSRSSYGAETPEDRMVRHGALALSIGLHPRLTCSTVHLAELMAAVPYRYTKEFIHPVRRGDAVADEPFYLFVWYRGMDLKRDGNRKLFDRIGERIDLSTVSLGAGAAHSYDIAKFFTAARKAIADDLYIWCETPPTERPYQT